jgi:hypothetical protein
MEALAPKRGEPEMANEGFQPEREVREEDQLESWTLSTMTASQDTDEEQTDGEGSKQWPPFHWLESPDITPIVSSFWNPKFDENDLAMYNRFLDILRLSKSGRNGDEIGRLLSISNVRKYLRGDKMSFLTQLRAEHDRLSMPTEGDKWLPLRLKPRGTPDKKWIHVPSVIRGFDDIVSVLNQLTPTSSSFDVMNQFGYKSKPELLDDRVNHLGFLMGTMLGDAGKSLNSDARFPSMKMSVVLSKAKPNSEGFGEFTSLAVNAALGLSMHRISDAPVSNKRYSKSECFQWIAPVSPLFTWVFRVMMGLGPGERTTYDPLRADWILGAPASFRIHFLQGLAESDGWVNPGRDVVIIVATPNERLLDQLLTGLSIPHRFEKQKVNIVTFGTVDGYKLPIFNQRIHSNNYDNLATMASAKRFPERSRLPTWFLTQVKDILTNCDNYDQAALRIASKTGYKISNQTVHKYAKTMVNH